MEDRKFLLPNVPLTPFTPLNKCWPSRSLLAKAKKAIVTESIPNRITYFVNCSALIKSCSNNCLISAKNSKKIRYLEKVVWLKSGIRDFENEKRQKTINPENNKTGLSNVKKLALFFSAKYDKTKNKKTFVNNCRANKKGSNTILKKTKGSATK